MEDLYQTYVDSLKGEIAALADRYAKRVQLKTLFMGGGTPTILAGAQLIDLLGCCRDCFSICEDAEISIEANPGTIDLDKLEGLRKAGVNRLSIGVQSFDDDELQFLGRQHSGAEAAEAFLLARRAGFTNVSLDLMYGIPGQTERLWRKNLNRALALGPEHLSLYQLTVEEGTPICTMEERGEIEQPEDGLVLAMDECNRGQTAEAGLFRYEISNYAKPGFECKHNINYWNNDDYLAAGAGAVSFVDGRRERRVEDPVGYCSTIEKGESLIVESEQLSREESFRETVIMGLRMENGVNLGNLERKYGLKPRLYYGALLERLIDGKLIELTPTHLRLTRQGRLLSNRVMAELV